MKILQISNYYAPHIGGIEQVAKDVTEAIEGHDIGIFEMNLDLIQADMPYTITETSDFYPAYEEFRINLLRYIYIKVLSIDG